MNKNVIGHVIGIVFSGWYFMLLAGNIRDYTNESLLVNMADRGVDTIGILHVGFFLGHIAMICMIVIGRCAYVLTTEFLNRNKKAAD